MTEREKRIQRIIEEIEQKPKFIADAIAWLLAHPVLTDGLCDLNNKLSDETIKSEMERAVREGDHVYYALLLYQKYVQEYGKAEDGSPQ